MQYKSAVQSAAQKQARYKAQYKRRPGTKRSTTACTSWRSRRLPPPPSRCLFAPYAISVPDIA
eukprot:19497-Rhodomonas_salina.1